MQRNVEALAATRHDLLVVGGGIAGAWVAWEATLAGLKVALIEKGDFCGATSANSSTILHGGLRYLQQADLPRMRQSITERRNLLSVAPHLTRPLPCVVPTYRELKHSRPVLRAGLLLTDFIGLDRNRGLSESRRLGSGRLVDREELALAAPGLEPSAVTGGALWYDAQVTSPARLVLAILRSANSEGAAVANYVEALAPICVDRPGGRRVTGVEARDLRTGRSVGIDARMVVDTTGPWAGYLAAQIPELGDRHLPPLCGGMNLVVRRPSVDRALHSETAWGGRIELDGGGSRFLFAVPWQDHVFFGTRYFHHEGTPDRLAVSEGDVSELLDSIRQAFPALGVQRADVTAIHAGVLPAEEQGAVGIEPTPIRHHRVIEHRETDALAGLITVVTEKLTTARHVAEEVVRRVLGELERTGPMGRSARVPVCGGDVEDLGQFLDQALSDSLFTNVSPATARGFVAHYGSEFRRVLEYLPGSSPQPDEAGLWSAGAAFAIEEEMPETLSDLALRRVYLGRAESPSGKALEVLARLMGRGQGWDDERIAVEIAAVGTKSRIERE